MAGCWTSFLDFICCRSPKDPSDMQFTKGKEAFEKYKTSKESKDLNEALRYFDLALKNRRTSPDGSGPPHVDLDVTLTTYASALFSRQLIKPSPSDLTKVIALEEEAFKLYETESDPALRPPEHTGLLSNLADAYFRQYVDSDTQDSFYKAMEKYEQLRRDRNASLELRRKGTMKMGIALTTWCDQEEERRTPQQKKEKLEQAIELLEEAMEMKGKEETPEDREESSTIREKCLYNLALAHGTRFAIESSLTGPDKAISDLNLAIKYNRDAREMLVKSRHPELVLCLFDLAQKLFAKYEYERNAGQPQHQVPPAPLLVPNQNKGLKELLEAKERAREALREIDERSPPGMRADLETLLETVETHSQHSLPNPQTLLTVTQTHSHHSLDSGSSQHSPANASSYSN